MTEAPIGTRAQAARHIAEECRNLRLTPSQLRGMTFPGHEDFPLVGDMVDEVWACLREH